MWLGAQQDRARGDRRRGGEVDAVLPCAAGRVCALILHLPAHGDRLAIGRRGGGRDAGRGQVRRGRGHVQVQGGRGLRFGHARGQPGHLREAASRLGERHDRVILAGRRIESIDQCESQVPAQRGRTGDGDLPVLAAGGRAADLDIQRAGGGLRIITGHGQRAAGTDRQAAAVGKIAGRREAGPAGETETATVRCQTGDGGDRRPGSTEGDRGRVAGDVCARGEFQGGAVERVPGAAGQGTAGELAEGGRAEKKSTRIGFDRTGIDQRAINGES